MSKSQPTLQQPTLPCTPDPVSSPKEGTEAPKRERERKRERQRERQRRERAEGTMLVSDQRHREADGVTLVGLIGCVVVLTAARFSGGLLMSEGWSLLLSLPPDVVEQGEERGASPRTTQHSSTA